jgi:dTDP-4-amino-4,6-dideoxygalactose transaminase
MNYRAGDFPASERAAAEIVSLPMFPTLTGEQQARVVKETVSYVSGGVCRQSQGVSLAAAEKTV